jgi:hypothetical protein
MGNDFFITYEGKVRDDETELVLRRFSTAAELSASSDVTYFVGYSISPPMKSI